MGLLYVFQVDTSAGNCLRRRYVTVQRGGFRCHGRFLRPRGHRARGRRLARDQRHSRSHSSLAYGRFLLRARLGRRARSSVAPSDGPVQFGICRGRRGVRAVRSDERQLHDTEAHLGVNLARFFPRLGSCCLKRRSLEERDSVKQSKHSPRFRELGVHVGLACC